MTNKERRYKFTNIGKERGDITTDSIAVMRKYYEYWRWGNIMNNFMPLNFIFDEINKLLKRHELQKLSKEENNLSTLYLEKKLTYSFKISH